MISEYVGKLPASYKQVDVLVDILDKQLIFQLIYPIKYVGISDKFKIQVEFEDEKPIKSGIFFIKL